MFKKYLWMLVILAVCGTNTVLTSCSSDEDKNQDDGSRIVTPETVWTEPTTDQMAVRVTVDVSIASLSQFPDPSTGAALVKRLPKVTATITDDTEFVLLKGSDVPAQSDAMMAKVANVLAMGGYVALVRPTESELDNFMDRTEKALALMVKNAAEEIFEELTPEQQEATVKASMAGRMQARRATLAGQTRAAAADEACAELIIFGFENYYFEEPLNDKTQVISYYTDADGNLVETEATQTFEENEATEYHYGLVADGAAQWINSVEAQYDDEDAWYTVDGASRRVLRHAAGDKAINDIMNATETFTRSFQVYFRTYNPSVLREKRYIIWGDRVTMTLRTWGAHNGDYDFYYVNQNVLLSMGMNDGMDPFFARYFSPVDWFEEFDDKGKKTGNRWYGNFLTRFVTSMDLQPNDPKSLGTIACMAATPETANKVVTQTVNTTQSTTSSSMHTHTMTVNIGWTAGSFGITGKYRYNGKFTTTDGNSFAMTNAKSVKDLEVVKNTLGNKVSWTYTGKPLTTSGPGNVIHDRPADILVNDANLVNDACWSVQNPSGHYTVKVGSWPATGVLLLNSKGDVRMMETKTTWDNEWNVTLAQPCRSLQKWRMFVKVLEWANGPLQGAQADLQKTLMRKFPDLFQSSFEIGELTEETVKNATAYILYSKKVFDVYKDILQGIAKSLGIKKFRITWSGDKNLETKEGYVVEVE